MTNANNFPHIKNSRSTVFANGNTSSKGVAILFSKKLKFNITDTFLDPDGRMIIVTIIIEPDALCFTLVNVYAPTQSHPHQQTSNLATLESKINKFNLDHLIIAGDFNLHLDPILDCVNVKPSNNSVNHVTLYISVIWLPF